MCIAKKCIIHNIEIISLPKSTANIYKCYHWFAINIIFKQLTTR